MSRRGGGMFDDFVLIFRELPLWCAPLGAAFAYVVLMYVAPAFLPEKTGPAAGMTIVFAEFFKLAAKWVAGGVLLLGLVGAIERRVTGGRRRQRRSRN